ncbi:hypothetical protein GGF49_003069 [Coemansia sp. RSA 1853]|nr:hypothetical protein GGF49_003069 [Coemansia sp. RSA 1853]
MDPVKDTVDFSNQNSGEVLPRAGNVATNAQSDISAEWNNLLFGGTSMSSQPQLPLSMLSMTPALTPEDLGLHTPAVSEPIMADVGLLNFAYPAFADTPVTPQATQHQHSGAGRARNIYGEAA